MVVFLTGKSGSGKTTLCHRVVATLKTRGVDVAGVLTLSHFTNGEKIGMEVMNVRTGEKRTLANRTGVGQGTAGLRWQFDGEGLKFGDRALRDAIPCSVLVVDELGPLELLHRGGWTNGIAALQSRQYECAFAVIRPALLTNMQTQLWGIASQTITVTLLNHEELYEQLVSFVKP